VRSLTVRASGPGDTFAVARLAALDSAPVPDGPLLLAEVDGELWAAVQLEGRAAIADPFRPSGELVALLHEQAREVERDRRAAGARRPHWWTQPRLARVPAR
jgi:hypothetical protein